MNILSLRRSLAALAAVGSMACAGAAKAPASPPRETKAVAATSDPKIVLRPADEARARLGIVVTSTSPEALAAELDAAAHDAGLPLALGQSALDLLRELPGGMGLSREQLSRLSPAESMALVDLGAAPGKADGVCAAFSFKDPALAKKTLDELGPETKRQDGMSARKLSVSDDDSSKKSPETEDVWAAVVDRTLLVASEPDVLLSAGALAMEAQHAPRDGQLVVTVHPQALLPRPALAAFVEGAVHGLDEQLEKDLASGKEKRLTPGMRRLFVAGFRALLRSVLEARSVRITARLDRKNGFLLSTDIEPAKPAAAGHPFTLDAALPILDDRTTVFAMGDDPAAVGAIADALRAAGPAGKSMAKDLDTFLNALVTGGSCTLSFAPAMSGICVYALRPGVTPKRALDSYATMLKDVQAWNDELLGPGVSKTKVKRSKDIIEVETTQTEADPTSRAVRASLFGGDTIRNAVTVRDGRLIQAQGPNPRELLGQIGAHQADLGKAPILAATLARYKDAEGLVYFDFMAMLGATTKAVKDPGAQQLGAMLGAVPGLTDLRAPLVVAIRGGATTGIDVQFPFQSLANVAQVVRPFVGKMGAAP